MVRKIQARVSERRISCQPGPQAALLASPVEDIFFGGARGGGKTYGMLLDWARHAIDWGAFATGVFFRRVAKNLEEVIQEAKGILPAFGFRWSASTSTFIGISGAVKGARLKFRHLMNKDDANDYQGHAYTWICFEEMTQWPVPDAIDLLRATLRSANGVKCVFRATGNPGGAGHNWVKARYISPAPSGYEIIVDQETGQRRTYIPSLLDDNKILMQSDPLYEARLKMIGNPSLVKAWRFGDWDIVAGGFFDDVWSPAHHVLRPFAIPPTWTYRRSFDWGSSKPGSLGMYAISDGTQPAGIDRRMPKGSVVRFAEWYTCMKGDDGLIRPNVGLKLSNEEQGHEIAKRSLNRNWRGCVADPSIFTRAGGPSIYDQMNKGAQRLHRALSFGPASNSRVPGWQFCRQFLEASMQEQPETPGFYVFDNCSEFIRTVPVLQMDPLKPDDVDTENEDHIGDEWRYMLMTLTAAVDAGGMKKVKLKGR